MKLLALEFEPASRGGQELSLAEECVGLARRGHRVTLLHGRDGDLLDVYRANGVRTLRGRDFTFRAQAPARTAFGLARTVLAGTRAPVEVVVVNQINDTLVGRGIATIKGAPLVCHLRLVPHGYVSRQFILGMRGVSRFVAVSEATRDAWTDRGLDPDAIDVAYDGIDTERFHPLSAAERARVRSEHGIPPDAFVLAYAGRLDPWKNVEGLLRHFRRLREREPNARLLVIGGAARPEGGADPMPYERELIAYAASLGLASCVHWLGHRLDVHRLLGAADAAALLSFGESFGRFTVESLACGIPVLATRHGGGSEILAGEFADYLVDVANDEEVSAKLGALPGWQLRDAAFAERARRRAVSRFSMDAMVRAIEASLQRAVAAGPMRRRLSRDLLGSGMQTVRS